ncbi:hypothetical protein [Hymenobacter fodinae]|uniref:Uncharacterized protein n=1 Tax=Hymenobacter fodinae TaxID=2510796 RepID=A0A4Z0P6R8_9BACT|nr:hypothetical protein [Hymenobacter fodinae]TGE07628.1 hypothetical protein EU556_07690 [Hymenobacter fodinae]
MIEPLLLSGLLGLFTSSAFAQTSTTKLPSETFKQHLRAQYLHNDTAQAIINLYGRRQAGGASWILGSGIGAVRLATASGSTTTIGGGYVIQQDPYPGAAFLLATPTLAYGVAKLLHYGNGKLERTLTAYAAGQSLPKSLRRKLKPRFFNQPIILYTPVPVTPVK